MRQRLAAVVAVLATVTTVYVTTLPEDRRSALHSQGVLHPYYHVCIFAAIAFLAALSTGSVRLRVLLCVGIAALGCVTEITEWQLYHHGLEWTDMVLDAVGAVAGTMLGAFVGDLAARRRI